MAQRASQKPTVQFNKGLITEAGELTFPEGASVDELNCSLERDGSRRRRLGLAYEDNHELGPSAAVGQTTAVNLWENAGGVAGLTFVVVQVGGKLHFYQEKNNVISPNKEAFTLSLSNYARPNSTSVATAPVQITSLQGRMVVASEEINTIEVEYKTNGSLTAKEIKFRIRDFEWVGNVRNYSEENVTNPERRYDTKNAGWKGERGEQALLDYITNTGKYPPLTLPWYAGKNQNADFEVSVWKDVYTGTSLIANGSYVYDLYDIDRVSASGESGAPNYVEKTRFKAVASYAGRVFYAGMGNQNSSNIFFSKLVQRPSDFGECLQANDPTSETISDLLDTDGGFINIPDIYNIRKLHVLGTQLIVLAENGIWSIRGVDGVFTPTAYVVSKIGDSGLTYVNSFVADEGGRPYWWSANGIMTLGVSQEQQTLTEVNISRPTIQTFFNNISPSKRAQVTATYDGFNSRVAWMYPDNLETEDYRLSNILWFDEELSAFYPWKIGDGQTGQYVIQPIFTRGITSILKDYEVVDEAGDTVVNAAGDTVIISKEARDYTASAIRLLVRDTSGRVTFAEFSDTGFLDWGTTPYQSFVEGSYNFLGDMVRKKNLLYFTSYFEVTEGDVVGDDTLGYNFTRPSSCKVSTYWDFRTSPSQQPQEAYRLKKLPIPTGAGPFEYPNTVTVSRMRLRGGGRSFRFRFDSTDGHDFHLLGFDTIAGANPR